MRLAWLNGPDQRNARTAAALAGVLAQTARSGGGGFATGTAGTDRISGRFHGPGDEEAWGVFDTGAYVGAFGTKRQ